MHKGPEIFLKGTRIGPYDSYACICQDGYSLSDSPVPGIDNNEVLARVNECQPLISTGGSYQNEILKSVFNIGLKRIEAKPAWIVPNSIRRRTFASKTENRKGVTSLESYVDSTIHRQFASLNKDMKHKLNFSNTYGLLRHHAVHNMVFRNPATGQQVQMGESLLWWQEEITDLASCLKLWDMISSENEAISDIVLWHRDGITIRFENEDIQLVSRANMNLLNKWAPGDSREPGLYFISLETDKRLANALTLKMSGSYEQEVCICPDSLLSAIWLMFLLEISGVTRLLRCEICGNYFNTNDPRAQFCSTRCRMRNYRKRKSPEQKNLTSQETV